DDELGLVVLEAGELVESDGHASGGGGAAGDGRGVGGRQRGEDGGAGVAADRDQRGGIHDTGSGAVTAGGVEGGEQDGAEVDDLVEVGEDRGDDVVQAHPAGDVGGVGVVVVIPEALLGRD